MKKAFVISAAAFIAIGAAVSSSTKANAEDARGGGVNIIRPAPVPPSAATPEKSYYHRPYYRHHYYHRRYAAITENLMLFFLAADRDR